MSTRLDGPRDAKLSTSVGTKRLMMAQKPRPSCHESPKSTMSTPAAPSDIERHHRISAILPCSMGTPSAAADGPPIAVASADMVSCVLCVRRKNNKLREKKKEKVKKRVTQNGKKKRKKKHLKKRKQQRQKKKPYKSQRKKCNTNKNKRDDNSRIYYGNLCFFFFLSERLPFVEFFFLCL